MAEGMSTLQTDLAALNLKDVAAFTAALSPWAALGFTLLGGFVGSLLMYLSFRVAKWMSECPEDCNCKSCEVAREGDKAEPLLPNTTGETDSQGSTTCSGGGWSEGVKADPRDATADPKAEGATSWSVLICTVLMSLPSMLGCWCWPLLLPLLMPSLGNSIASDSNREAAHHFTFGVDVVLFCTVIAYVGRTASDSKEGWGPLSAVSLGCALLILDPIRHILLDHGGVFFQEQDLAMYSDKGGLTPIGLFGQFASIAGMVLLMSGVLWHMKVPQAIFDKCSGAAIKTL